MPDITMCTNKSCPLNRNCYRFMAKPNPDRQAYADFAYTVLPDNIVVCENQMKRKGN